MIKTDPIPVPDSGESQPYCMLRRVTPSNEGKPSVVFFHGASAARDTFLAPNGGIAKFLHNSGLDVWLADWRGGWRIGELGRTLPSEDPWHHKMTLDDAIEDVGVCVEIIENTIKSNKISVVGHCLGGAVVAMAIASGRFDPRNKRVILSTMGLFYQGSSYSQLKVADEILERLALGSTPELRWIDPQAAGEKKWIEDLEKLYVEFGMLDSQRCEFTENPDERKSDYCNRLTFMYGRPYLERNLHTSIHGDLDKQFGAVHAQLYLHGARNLKRQWAAPFSAGNSKSERGYFDNASKANFGELEKTLLITGDQNELWHRDGIDRMYEWLVNGISLDRQNKVRRRIFEDYGHQDLFWGLDSSKIVYPEILEFLT